MELIAALILAASGALAILILAIRSGLEAGFKKVAELGAENANWGTELKNELQKVRGTARQELRFAAYKGLWTKQRPLAIYEPGLSGEPSGFGRDDAEALLRAQSNWYFDEAGGLMMTPHVRDFYFVWQDLLKAVMEQSGWFAERSAEKPGKVFRELLAEPEWDDAKGALGTLDYVKGMEQTLSDWPAKAATHTEGWEDAIAILGTRWLKLTSEQQFAVLQQVSSTLRTAMTYDMETRVR